jgi:hypothetical protein
MSGRAKGWIGSARLFAAACALAAAAFGADTASAFPYASGDVLYVAYQSPSGPNYIVNLGSRNNLVNATTTINFPDVSASDLNTILGAAGTNLWVGLFAVLNTSTRDGIVSANGPVDDFSLQNSSILGALNQIDSFGGGVTSLSLPVPSANPNAGKFTSGGSTGSYQSTLNGNGGMQGALAGNVQWNVETQLSNAAGTRNPTAVNIPFYKAIRNSFTGTMSRGVIGFFTLNPNGTMTYSPDADGDFIADDVDLCPGVNSPDNSDADGDHHAPACDCNPTNAAVWAIPGEATSLTFSTNTAFAWTAPSNLGGTTINYDVLQAPTSSSGAAPAFGCFQPNLASPSSTDAANPALGRVFQYLARAGNACGDGVAGTTSTGTPISAPACP